MPICREGAVVEAEKRERRAARIANARRQPSDEEMPSSTEREHGLENIRGFMSAHEKLDFVFTHDAPASDKLYLGYDSVDELNKYLESLQDNMKYDKWFYGHLHANRKVMDNHYLLYEQILQIA